MCQEEEGAQQKLDSVLSCPANLNLVEEGGRVERPTAPRSCEGRRGATVLQKHGSFKCNEGPAGRRRHRMTHQRSSSDTVYSIVVPREGGGGGSGGKHQVRGGSSKSFVDVKARVVRKVSTKCRERERDHKELILVL